MAQERTVDGKDLDFRTTKRLDDGSVSVQLAAHSTTSDLVQNVANQYALTASSLPSPSPSGPTTGRYCTRHHPDLKCKRQADAKSMDMLQKELEDLPQSSQEACTRVWSLFSTADAPMRSLMVRGILAQCCSPRIQEISAIARELSKIDFVSLLPPEVAIGIFKHMNSVTNCKARLVSRRWKQYADDDEVWALLCKQHVDKRCEKCGIGLPSLQKHHIRSETRQNEMKAAGCRGTHEQEIYDHGDGGSVVVGSKRTLNSDIEDSVSSAAKRFRRDTLPPDSSHLTIPGPKSWKDIYRESYCIAKNWDRGRFGLREFKGHRDSVLCLYFDEQKLVSGGYDRTVKVWDMATGRQLRSFKGHREGLRSVKFDGHLIASGSLDTDIIVWDLRDGSKVHTLTGHSGAVVGLDFQYPYIVSGSADNTIKVWDLSARRVNAHQTLPGHTDWVNSVKIDMSSRTILSASDDRTIRLWDLDEGTLIRTFEGHAANVQSAVFMPRCFEVSTERDENSDDDGSAIDRSRSSSPLSVPPSPVPDIPTEGRVAPPRYMVSGSLDSTLRLWDTQTGQSVRTLFGHIEGIWAVAADSLRIISGAHDGLTKVWDPRSGKCERTFANHGGAVSCLHLNERRMATGGDDDQILVYNFDI